MTAQVIMLRSALHSSMTRRPGGCNGVCNEWGRSCYKSHRIKPEVLSCACAKTKPLQGTAQPGFELGAESPAER